MDTSYDTVKSSIRLLLTSASNGLTMAQLDADYQRYNRSAHIPFADFGYITLVSHSFYLFTSMTLSLARLSSRYS